MAALLSLLVDTPCFGYAHNRNIANMAGDGSNSASVLSLSLCFGGRNDFGHSALYLAFATSIKL